MLTRKYLDSRSGILPCRFKATITPRASNAEDFDLAKVFRIDVEKRPWEKSESRGSESGNKIESTMFVIWRKDLKGVRKVEVDWVVSEDLDGVEKHWAVDKIGYKLQGRRIELYCTGTVKPVNDSVE